MCNIEKVTQKKKRNKTTKKFLATKKQIAILQ